MLLVVSASKSLVTSLRTQVQRSRSNSLVRNSMLIMGTNMCTAAIGYGYWIVAARLYSPHDVGLGSALISAIMLAAVLSNLGIGSTLIQVLPGSQSGIDWSLKFNAGLATGLGVGLLGGILLLVLPLVSTQSAGFSHQGTATALVLATGVPVMTTSVLLDQAFVAERAAQHMLLHNVAYALLKVVLIVLSVWLGHGSALAITLSWTVSATVSTLAAGFILVPRLHRDYRLAFRGMLRQIRTLMSSFAGHHFINVGGMIPGYLLPVLVAVRLSAADNAYYYTAMKIGDFFFMGSSAVAAALFAEGSLAGDDLTRKIRSSVRLIGLLFVPAALVCLVFGREVLAVFGAAYAQHGLALLRVDVASAVPDAITNVYISMLRVRRQLRYAASINLGMAFLTLALAWVLLPTVGVIGAAWAFFIAETAGCVMAGGDILRRRLWPCLRVSQGESTEHIDARVVGE